MNKKKGFTLIELLVVIAIIGILSSIVLVALRGARNKAKDARIIADMGQIRSVAEVVYDGETGYDALAADGDYTTLTADITSQGGSVTLQQSGSDYCAYTALNGGGYYCVDSTGAAGETTSMTGYCDGSTAGHEYTCP